MTTGLKYYTLLSFFLITSVFVVEAKNEKEKTEDIDIFELVDSQMYTFEAESLTSTRGFNRSLNSSYDMTMHGDSATAYLPYFGRSYSASFSGEGGIVFDNIMTEYEVSLKEKKKEKNNTKYVSFKVKGEHETYNCDLSVGKSGYANLSIRSNNKQGISFRGTIVPIEE